VLIVKRTPYYLFITVILQSLPPVKIWLSVTVIASISLSCSFLGAPVIEHPFQRYNSPLILPVNAVDPLKATDAIL
jgi:hypothetical protein